VHLRYILFSALLVFASSAAIALTPETASYPDKNARFTVQVPNGWQAARENGALKLIAEANAVVLFQFVQDIKSDEAAKTALPQLAEMEGHQFDLEKMQISYHVRDADNGEFKGYMTDAKGTDKGGHETMWQSVIFAPREGEYYLMTALWTTDDTSKTASDRADIFKSLKATNMQGN
jgi:hypothetical protein